MISQRSDGLTTERSDALTTERSDALTTERRDAVRPEPSEARATVGATELTELCRAALERAGADAAAAEVLAAATVEAEAVGNRAVGVAHLFDYLDGYRVGRIAADVVPEVHWLAPGMVDVDARGGLAQTAFTAGAEDLTQAVREVGLAALWVRGSFTCGELGWYARRVAEQGLLALAAANSPALMSLGGAPHPVLGTNPVAFGFPRADGWPVVIDQASSATAFVNIRGAAARGEPLPPGWALDADGTPTTDAHAALAGTLLPFGGHRGGNIALLVEVLATLSGGAFSLDAAPFDRGEESPGIGVFVLAVDPGRFAGSAVRLTDHLERLASGDGVRLPAVELRGPAGEIDLAADLLARLRAA